MTMPALSLIARAMLQWRARRLPPPLAERLLEEWLAEVETLAAPRRLAFAFGVLLTRTSTLVRAGADEDGRQEGTAISIDDVLVPATELPTLAAAFLLDLLWIAPIGLLVLWLFELPRPYHLFEWVIAATIVAVVHGVQIARYGGSVGMLVMKLRVVTIDGGPLRVRHLIVRAASMLVFPTAFSLLAMLGFPSSLRGVVASAAPGAWMAAFLLDGSDRLSTKIVYAVPRVLAPRDQ
jgi:uncharacterized RDD family membrane protein YckC